MNDIKVARGASPIETMAIDARLARLGIEIDSATRTIKEESIAGSHVEGGRGALTALLKGAGELDLDMLVQVRMKPLAHDRFGEKVRAFAGEKLDAVGLAHLKAYPGALRGAARELTSFVEWFDHQTKIERAPFFNKLGSALRKFNHAAEELKKLESTGVLAFATREDLREMKAAYAELLQGLRPYADRLDGIYRETFTALNKSTLTNLMDVPVLALVRMQIPGEHRALAGSVAEILGAERLFEAPKATVGDIVSCFDKNARGEVASFPANVTQFTAAIALNTVQKLFTDAYGNDGSLKALVADKQRENAFTHRVGRHANEVLGDRNLRAKQIDALRVLLNIYSGAEDRRLREEISSKLDSMGARLASSSS